MSATAQRRARVAVFLPLAQLFDYTVPERLVVRAGTRVWAPWGSRSLEGVVVELDPPDAAATPAGKPVRLRALAGVVAAPALGEEMVRLARWISEHYLAPLGEVLRLFLPAGGKARVKRRVRPTDEGRRVQAALAAALEPAWLGELGLLPEARALMSDLGEERLVDQRLDAWRALEERALVVVDEEVRVVQRKAERWLSAARPLVDGELARAPKQLAVYQRIAAAGRLHLEALRAEAGEVNAALRALIAGGLVQEEQTPPAQDVFAAIGDSADTTPAPVLTDDQTRALATMLIGLEAGAYTPILLHGVTGSGKTEVYLRLIAHALEAGRSALVLVPEISLTPQLAARFLGRFGPRVAVLHSGVGQAARAAAFARILAGEVSIVVGARSAVFAPLVRLGVVIVDEEHDSSFKQQDGVRYHARDVALMRARFVGAVAVLGSATPSLEAFAAAGEGRLGLCALPTRPLLRPLPSVEIVDLRMHKLPDGNLLSAPLAAALGATLAAGEQSIVFLNRRGYATFLLCKSCGEGVRCQDCAVTLTYHRRADRVVCHYCGFRAGPPRVCAKCGARAIEHLGVGTEQAEAQIVARFPGARVARLDRDTAEGAGLMRILAEVRAGRVDILVGTQMITKGHDFPGVTLVGVLLADHGMGLPDFRASERTFQLLAQVAGRAGRAERPGRVIVQTYQPKHPAVVAAREHDYHAFARAELAQRRELDYPPQTRMACVLVDGADPQRVREVAEAVARLCLAAVRAEPPAAGAAVLGPAEAPLARLKGRSRWQVFVKARQAAVLRRLGQVALSLPATATRGTRVAVDIDPISTL